MNPVPYQSSYDTVQPLPEPQPNISALTAIVQRVAFSVMFGLFGGSIGGAFGMMGWTVTIMDGVLSGMVIGTVGSIAFGIFVPLPTGVESYRMSVLTELEKATVNGRVKAALKNLKNFLYYPLERFGRPFDYVLFHSEISVVTDLLDRSRPDALKAWALLLKHLHGTKVKLSGEDVITLDMSREYHSRLYGKKEKVEFSWLTTYFANPDAYSLRQIYRIQRETLGRDECYDPHVLGGILRNRNNHCVVSRDQATNEIVGYGWYFSSGKRVEIGGLSRRPNYTRLGIGHDLLMKMLEQFDTSQTVTTRVRKSNPAIQVFKKFGFEAQQDLPSYYRRDPKEDGVELKLNWTAYQKLSQQ